MIHQIQKKKNAINYDLYKLRLKRSRHSATNARTLGDYMYISAFDLRSDEQFASAHEKIKKCDFIYYTHERSSAIRKSTRSQNGIYSYQK